MESRPEPSTRRPLRLLAIAALAGLVILAGAFGYELASLGRGGSTTSVAYFGSVQSGPVVRSADCEPYESLVAQYGDCNATQVSVPFWVNSTNVLGLTELSVRLNVTQGPACAAGAAEPHQDHCRYMLELSSPTNPPVSGQQPPSVNLTVYLVSQSQTWLLPVSGYGANLTIRYVEFGPTTPFVAELRIQWTPG